MEKTWIPVLQQNGAIYYIFEPAELLLKALRVTFMQED